MNSGHSEPEDTLAGGRAGGSPPSVLVVDDEEAILFGIEDYLTATGWRVATAATPEQAAELLAHGTYSVALVDLRLSDDDGARRGLDVVRRIRERSPVTPVVLLTAYGSADVELEASRMGVASLLVKPQPLPRLDAHLRELIAAAN